MRVNYPDEILLRNFTGQATNYAKQITINYDLITLSKLQ